MVATKLGLPFTLGKDVYYWIKIKKVLDSWLIESPEALDSALKENFFKGMNPGTRLVMPLLLRFSAAEICLFNRCAKQLGGIDK